MERTAIQFRVHDLLLATSVVAIHVAGMVHAMRHLKPGELSPESFVLFGTLIVFAACIVSRNYSGMNAHPETCPGPLLAGSGFT